MSFFSIPTFLPSSFHPLLLLLGTQQELLHLLPNVRYGGTAAQTHRAKRTRDIARRCHPRLVRRWFHVVNARHKFVPPCRGKKLTELYLFCRQVRDLPDIFHAVVLMVEEPLDGGFHQFAGARIPLIELVIDDDADAVLTDPELIAELNLAHQPCRTR